MTIHIDFPHDHGNGWYANNHLHQAGMVFAPDQLKLRVFLQDDELWLLTSCPYMGKISRATRPHSKPYCLYIYPRHGKETAEDIMKWAHECALTNIALFSLGDENSAE